MTFAVVAGSDVTAEGRAGSGSGRRVWRRQIQSAPAAGRRVPEGRRRAGRGFPQRRRLARVSVRTSLGAGVWAPAGAGGAAQHSTAPLRSEPRATRLLRDGEPRGGAGEARSTAGLGARKGRWRAGPGPALASSPQGAGAAPGRQPGLLFFFVFWFGLVFFRRCFGGAQGNRPATRSCLRGSLVCECLSLTFLHLCVTV